MMKISIWRWSFYLEEMFSFAETPQAQYKYGDRSLLLCTHPYAMKVDNFHYE